MPSILCTDPAHAEHYLFVEREVAPGDEILIDWFCGGRQFTDDHGDAHFVPCDADPTRFPDQRPEWTDGTF